MNTRSIIAAGILLGIVALGPAWWTDQQTDSSSVQAREELGIRPDRALEPASSLRSTEHVARRPPAPANPFAAAVPLSPQEEPAELEPTRRERMREREFAQTQRRAESLDEALARQTPDERWMRAVRQQVAEIVHQGADQAGSAIDRIECGSSLCRIEAKHRDGRAERELLQQLVHLPAFRRVQAFAQRLERGGGWSSTRIYISRGGQRLPPTPQATD